MTRRLRAWNRVAAFAVGLILLAAGAGAILWQTDRLDRWWDRAPQTLDATRVTEVTSTDWWRWACLGAGIVLAVLGLWWLLSHLRPRRLGTVYLRGSDPSGTLTLSSRAPLAHLATLIRELPRVVGSEATLVRERDVPVLVLTTTVRADADLPRIARRLAELGREFAHATSQPDLAVRNHIEVARRVRRPERIVE